MKLEDFKRDLTLEQYPYIIDKTERNFEAYNYGCDIGFVILKYPNCVELYDYDSSPYRWIETFKSMQEAVDYANELS